VRSATAFVDVSNYDRILKVPLRTKISVVLDTAPRGMVNRYVSKQLAASVFRVEHLHPTNCETTDCWIFLWTVTVLPNN